MKKQKNFLIGAVAMVGYILLYLLLTVLNSLIYSRFPSFLQLINYFLWLLPMAILTISYLLPVELPYQRFLFAGGMALCAVASFFTLIQNVISYIRYQYFNISIFFSLLFSLFFILIRLVVALDAGLMKYKLRYLSIGVLGLQLLFNLISLLGNFISTIQQIFKYQYYQAILNPVNSAVAMIPTLIALLFLFIVIKPAPKAVPADTSENVATDSATAE